MVDALSPAVGLGMLTAGAYRYRVTFEKRETRSDGYGNEQADWVPVWTCWAAFLPRFGREAVAAGKLESTDTGTLTVRSCSEARAVDAAHRVGFVTGPYRGRQYQIRSIVPTMDGAEIEMVIEHGVAL